MKDTKEIPTLSEAIGRGKLDFFPDLPWKDKEELLAADFDILNAKIVEEWESEFGTGSFCLLRVRLDDGTLCTSLIGGKAIVRQVSKLLRDRKIPVRVCLNKCPGTYGDYWVFIDPQQPRPENIVSLDTTEEQPPSEEPIFEEGEG